MCVIKATGFDLRSFSRLLKKKNRVQRRDATGHIPTDWGVFFFARRQFLVDIVYLKVCAITATGVELIAFLRLLKRNIARGLRRDGCSDRQ